MEILIAPDMVAPAQRMLHALADTAPISVSVVNKPTGNDPLLMVYGPGHPVRRHWTDAHKAQGGTLVIWDAGYFRVPGRPGNLRLSVGRDHPQRLLDRVTPGARWDSFGLRLRDDKDSKGPILLIGLGPKTRAIIDDQHWEARALAKLRRRFPRKLIIFRPKPGRAYPRLPCPTDATTPIAQLLQGASLVVCRHSNVAVDAVIAGVPFEATDGAAKWLDGKPYTRENRFEFLRRLAWFDWCATEAHQAWGVILKCV